MSDSLQPHGLQHARPPCPSPTPGVYSNPCPSSRWCHPAISSSVIPFSSCPQPLPASGSFPVSQLFTWGGPSIGVSASASVLPMNTQDWFPLGWTGWISLQSKGLSRIFSKTIAQKPSIFWCSAFFTVQLSHPYRTTECLLRTRHYTRFIPLIITLEFYSYYIRKIHDYHSSGGSEGKESACNVGDLGSVPGSGRFPGEGSGYPLQYSCLENPMQRGSLAGSSPWGCKEAGMTEWLMLSITKKKKGWGKLRHAELKVIFPKFPSVLISSDWCHKIP